MALFPPYGQIFAAVEAQGVVSLAPFPEFGYQLLRWSCPREEEQAGTTGLMRETGRPLPKNRDPYRDSSRSFSKKSPHTGHIVSTTHTHTKNYLHPTLSLSLSVSRLLSLANPARGRSPAPVAASSLASVSHSSDNPRVSATSHAALNAPIEHRSMGDLQKRTPRRCLQ